MNCMMQPDAPTPSQVADVSDVSASRTAGYAAHPLPLAPGIRQDHTQSFLSFRKSHLEKRKNDMPSRLDWLLSIIGGGDAEQLLYFVEANKQLCETTQPGETCAHCSARVTNNSRSRADDYQPANRCTICQRWHCEKHCNFVVTLSFATRVVKLPCCEKCYRTVASLLKSVKHMGRRWCLRRKGNLYIRLACAIDFGNPRCCQGCPAMAPGPK
ncbi:unnamed protein product [Durusdinium trenchii]|uniref:Uncharacterized protein n=1 Tax=Durusdinium trenchii TaxID=1381693 RepID=A0ABP0PQC8_9DINO